MSSAYQKFNCFVADIGNKLHNLGADSLQIMLTNTAPVATNTVYSNLADLSTANGYTAGGTAIGSNAYSQVSGLATLTGSNVVYTATGSVGPFRYPAIYNNTASGKNLIGFYDYGSSVTLVSGETFTVNLSSGILTLQ
jgi:hypothetical protein